MFPFFLPNDCYIFAAHFTFAYAISPKDVIILL